MGSRGYSQNEEPRRPNTLGDHRAVTIEEPSREAVELVEIK